MRCFTFNQVYSAVPEAGRKSEEGMFRRRLVAYERQSELFLRCITVIVAYPPPLLRYRACQAPPCVKSAALCMLGEGTDQRTAISHAESGQPAAELPFRWPWVLGLPHTAEPRVPPIKGGISGPFSSVAITA